MMLDVPVGRIGSIYVQLYADLEDTRGLLSVEVAVSDEGGDTLFEIMKSVLVVTAVTASVLVWQYSVNSLISSS